MPEDVAKDDPAALEPSMLDSLFEAPLAVDCAIPEPPSEGIEPGELVGVHDAANPQAKRDGTERARRKFEREESVTIAKSYHPKRQGQTAVSGAAALTPTAER